MRSILKHPRLSDLSYHPCPEPFPFASCTTVVEVSPHVHFPPTPTLTSTFITHSSSVYDRTPAEVLPNTCALPGRHEREFTDTSRPRRPRCRWNYEEASYFSRASSQSMDSSESDESDVLQTPPEPVLLAGHPIAVRFASRNTSEVVLPCSPTQQEIESALLFLPHAPSKTKMSRRSSSLGSSKEPREESADGRIQQRHGGFAVPTLDFEGCLGGF